MEDRTLPILFEQAQKIQQIASDSSIEQETVRNGCELLRKCEDIIGKLGLFSSNETKDDISTTNLKYLLVPYYLGDLTEKNSLDDRIQILKASLAKLKEFISFCEAMELVPKEELESSMHSRSNSSADQRAKKIARVKPMKAAESKLLEIKERREPRGRSTRASALSTPIETWEEDLEDDDGEEERDAWMATISLALCKSFDLSKMLKKEEEMLLAVKEKQSKEGENDHSQSTLNEHTHKAEARYTKSATPITCATFAQDVLEGQAKVSQFHKHKHQPMIFGPTSIVSKIPTSEATQVFQPYHSNLEVDYGSEENARIVYTALTVDKELQPDKVKRQMSISNGKLLVHFEAVEARFLRASYSAFLDILTLASKTIEEFGQ